MDGQVLELNIPNFYAGLNTVDSPNSLAPNQLIKSQNWTFGYGNMMEIRKGNTIVRDMDDADDPAPITGLWRYNGPNSDNYNLWLHGGFFLDDDDAVAASGEATEMGRNFRYTTVAGASEETAQFDADADSSWEVYRDILYHSNGVDEQVAYRQTEWGHDQRLRQTGVPVPTTTCTGVTATGGTLVAGIYKVLWTLEINDGVIVEGNPQGTGSACVVTASTDNKITYTVTVPEDDETYAKLNWYITDVGGNVFYWWKATTMDGTGTYAETLTNYTEIVIDEDNEMATDNYRPPIGTVNRKYNNTMIIGGDPDNTSYLYGSKWNRYEQFPGHLATGTPVSTPYILDLEDEFIGMERALNGGLVIICKSSIQLITGSNSDTWSRQIISDSVGGVHRRCICVGTDGAVYWLGIDGIYCSDGNQVIEIGRNVWDKFMDLSFAQLSKSVMWYHRKRLYIQYPDSNSEDYANKTLELDTRYKAESQWGAWVGPHKGMMVNCFARSAKEDESYSYWGSSERGQVNRFNYGDTDGETSRGAGSIITAQLETGYMFLGGPALAKRFYSFAGDVKPTTAKPTCTLIFDSGSPKSFSYPASLYKEYAASELWQAAATANDWDPNTYTWMTVHYVPVKEILPQAAQGASLQIKVECVCSNTTYSGAVPTTTADRSFAFRNLGLGYSVIRRE